VIDVILPTPRHQQVYVQEISHGKSASISRTDSVDNEGNCGLAAKIFAPVYLQRVRRTLPDLVSPAPVALRRR
jgi:hypothetical protein